MGAPAAGPQPAVVSLAGFFGARGARARSRCAARSGGAGSCSAGAQRWGAAALRCPAGRGA
eukprot:12070788-Alexandrium_andersonii.AAC.1